MRYRRNHSISPHFEVEALEPRILLSGTTETVLSLEPFTLPTDAIIAEAKIDSTNAPSRSVRRTRTPGDRFENNNTANRARDLGTLVGINRWDRLSFHQGDQDDWFTLTWFGRAGRQDRISVRSMTSTRTNLSLYLYNDQGKLVRFKRNPRRLNDYLQLHKLKGGTYTLRIHSDAPNPHYELTTRTPSDILEDEHENNDRWWDASHLGTADKKLTTSKLTMDNSDGEPDPVDWYTFDLTDTGGVSAEVDIQFKHSQGDLDMVLYGPDGYWIDGSFSATNNEAISLAGQAAGRYFLVVYGYHGATNPDYTLTITAPLEPHASDEGTDPVSDAPVAGDPSTWTVLVYAAADNNLESFGLIDVNEMESATLPDWMRAGVLLDRAEGYSSAQGNWTDTRVGEILQDNNPYAITSTMTSWGERNMGDPDTLIEFVEWGVANLPAENYALVIWNHGGGIDGIASDDTSGDHLTVAELDYAMNELDGVVDVLGFDACLMGSVEVVTAVSDSVKYVVGSEALEGGNGWDYRDLINDLRGQGRNMGARRFARTVVNSARDDAAISTLSAIDTNAVNTFTTALRQFTNRAFNWANKSDWRKLSAARNRSDKFYNSAFRDLGDFLTEVVNSNINGSIRQRARVALNAYNAMIINNYAARRDNGTGLHAYMPAGSFRSFYGAMDFNTQTNWQAFVQQIQASDDRVAASSGRAGALWNAPALMTI
jgi:hypothetical protein